MTELQVFLTYLLNLPTFKYQSHDIARLARRIAYLIKHVDLDGASNLLLSLIDFDDAVVFGLNSGVFSGTFPSLSRYPQSVLPKFLFGMTSQIFDPTTGRILSNYDVDSVEALLTGLRLLRRADIPGRDRITTSVAIDEFMSPQTAPMPVICDKVASAMTTFWSVILSDFDESLTLGFPGNGVTSDMEFPYVPKLSFVDPYTLPPSIRIPMQIAMIRKFPENYDIPAGCEFIKIYPYVPYPERIATLSVVPKSFKTGRAITITNTSSVIIGATLRETCWELMRKKGYLSLVNVHDQKSSHRLLIDKASTTFRRDIKGGSTCIRIASQRQYLSSNRYAKALFENSIPSGVRLKSGEVFDLVTLTQGDSSCTAMLTIDMLGFLVISQFYYEQGHYAITRPDVDRILALFIKDDNVRCVGDDVQGPEHLSTVFDTVAQSQGVVINHRKSSDAGARHGETCGAWVVFDPNTNAYRQIYPFRAPKLTKDLVSDLSTLRRSYERTIKSKFSVAVFIAYCTFLTHQLEYLGHEGFTTSDIGSEVGIRPLRRMLRIRPLQLYPIHDDIAYAFGFPGSGVIPRFTRRPTLERGRICKSRDITRERSISPYSISEVCSAYDDPRQSLASLTQMNFAIAALFVSNAKNLIYPV